MSPRISLQFDQIEILHFEISWDFLNQQNVVHNLLVWYLSQSNLQDDL